MYHDVGSQGLMLLFLVVCLGLLDVLDLWTAALTGEIGLVWFLPSVYVEWHDRIDIGSTDGVSCFRTVRHPIEIREQSISEAALNPRGLQRLFGSPTLGGICLKKTPDDLLGFFADQFPFSTVEV